MSIYNNRRDSYNQDAKLGAPGQYPFTRGIYPLMYRERLWTMRQYAGSGNAQKTNELFKYLLKQGQTGLSVAFDLPTQLGYDSDSEFSIAEMGNVGVVVDTLADMRRLFKNIPLEKISASMTINAPAVVLMAMYITVAEEQGVAKDQIRGTIQNDILKEYVARGAYIFPPLPSLRLVTDLIEYCCANCPSFNPISISGYHMREAGCTAAQEIGFTFANAIEYINQVLQRGVPIDKFAPRLSFFFSAHNNLLEEVAKFRAARRLWAKIIKERFKAVDENSMKFKFHAQTAGSTLTAQQPENNIARVALQALSAVLGGVQSLHTNSFDEALSLPSQKAATIALRTQQILAYECGLTEAADPLGGSLHIEALTDQMEQDAGQYIRKIDQLGGVVAAIETGYIQQKIQDAAYSTMLDIERGRQIVVGVNRFNQDRDVIGKSNHQTTAARERAVDRLRKLRAKRDQRKVSTSLQQISHAISTKVNIMPTVINAVKSYCTIGEICTLFREKFGEYSEQHSF